MPTLDRLPPASHIPLPPAAVFVDRLSQGDRGGDQQKTIHSFDWWCRAPVSTGTDYPHLIFHKNKEPVFSDEHKQHLQGTEYIRIWHFNSEYDSCLQCLLNTSGWPYRCLGEVVREKTVLLSVLLSIKYYQMLLLHMFSLLGALKAEVQALSTLGNEFRHCQWHQWVKLSVYSIHWMRNRPLCGMSGRPLVGRDAVQSDSRKLSIYKHAHREPKPLMA